MHPRTPTHYLQDVPGQLAEMVLLLLTHTSFFFVNLTLPKSLVNTLLMRLTPQILTTQVEYIPAYYLYIQISSCNLDLHYSLFFESCRHRGLLLTYYILMLEILAEINRSEIKPQ